MAKVLHESSVDASINYALKHFCRSPCLFCLSYFVVKCVQFISNLHVFSLLHGIATKWGTCEYRTAKQSFKMYANSLGPLFRCSTIVRHSKSFGDTAAHQSAGTVP